MIAFKSCPRCGRGDVVTNYDETYCVQCGWRPVAIIADVRDELQTARDRYEMKLRRLRNIARMQRLEAAKAPKQLTFDELVRV